MIVEVGLGVGGTDVAVGLVVSEGLGSSVGNTSVSLGSTSRLVAVDGLQDTNNQVNPHNRIDKKLM